MFPNDAPETAESPEPAPPAAAGAGDDIDIVDVPPAGRWAHDGEGYPLEAGLDGAASPAAGDPDGRAGKEDGDALPSFSGIGSHLDELRKRLIMSLAIFAPLFIIGVYLYQELWMLVIRPLDRASPDLARFQALNPSDGLVMAMRIAFAFALFISLPFLLIQIWAFVAPGLTQTEKRWLYLALGSGGLLFLIGAGLAYFVGIPFALEYLLPFNRSLSGWENQFTGTGYVDFVITCCLGFGIAFELPLVMLALGWAGILTPEGIRQWWRAVVLGVVFLAAILTPPDPFTQMLLALPMLVLFVLGYWLVKLTHRRRE